MEQHYDVKNIKAIIGLGNPGSQYYRHRHSIGFRVLDELAQEYGATWRTAENMDYALIRVNDQEIFLIKPTTYMNSSGKVLPWLQKKGIKADQILVVHDELEKKFGEVLLKFGGSHKGHNGLKSIMNMIGADFWRLRFGIGRPEEREEVPNYVLTDFSKDQESQLPLLIAKAIGIIFNK